MSVTTDSGVENADLCHAKLVFLWFTEDNWIRSPAPGHTRIFFNMFSYWWPVKLDNKLGSHGPWAGPEKEESGVHGSLGLGPSLGHRTYIPSSPWMRVWGIVRAGRTKWSFGVGSICLYVSFLRRQQRNGGVSCHFPSVVPCFCCFFSKIKFAFQSDWQLSWWKRRDLSPSPEMWTLQHLHSGENCSLSEVLSPKTEVVIRRSLASKTADVIYI